MGKRPITKGQIIAITTGEYSDYCLRDHLRALRDFDAIEEANRFREIGDYKVPNDWSDDPESSGSDDRFLAWAIREGLLEPLEPDTVTELHIGSYGCLELGWAEPTTQQGESK